MPLAISCHRVNIWYHTDLHDQWKRVTPGQFLFNDLQLAKLVSTNDGPSYSSTFSHFFQAEARKKTAPRFARSDRRYSKAYLWKFARKNMEDLT